MPKKQWKMKQHTQDDDFSVWSGPYHPQLIFLRPQIKWSNDFILSFVSNVSLLCGWAPPAQLVAILHQHLPRPPPYPSPTVLR